MFCVQIQRAVRIIRFAGQSLEMVERRQDNGPAVGLVAHELAVAAAFALARNLVLLNAGGFKAFRRLAGPGRKNFICFHAAEIGVFAVPAHVVQQEIAHKGFVSARLPGDICFVSLISFRIIIHEFHVRKSLFAGENPLFLRAGQLHHIRYGGDAVGIILVIEVTDGNVRCDGFERFRRLAGCGQLDVGAVGHAAHAHIAVAPGLGGCPVNGSLHVFPVFQGTEAVAGAVGCAAAPGFHHHADIAVGDYVIQVLCTVAVRSLFIKTAASGTHQNHGQGLFGHLALLIRRKHHVHGEFCLVEAFNVEGFFYCFRIDGFRKAGIPAGKGDFLIAHSGSFLIKRRQT